MSRCNEVIRELSTARLNMTKMAIMFYLLVHGWGKLGEIAKQLGITKSSAWKHIKDLQERGLVKVKYTLGSHPQMMVALTDKGIETVMRYTKILEDVLKCVGSEDEKGVKEDSAGTIEHGEDRARSTHTTDKSED